MTNEEMLASVKHIIRLRNKMYAIETQLQNDIRELKTLDKELEDYLCEQEELYFETHDIEEYRELLKELG